MGRGRGQGVRGAVQALCVLLRNDAARTYFGRQGGVAYLTKIIRMQVRRRERVSLGSRWNTARVHVAVVARVVSCSSVSSRENRRRGGGGGTAVLRGVSWWVGGVCRAVGGRGCTPALA